MNQLLFEKGNYSQKLFAYPAQSNVTGVKHNLDWISKAQAFGWDVLLDAAAFAPTSPLDLSVHQPDFVCLSFYKLFGYPTGIGCLLVKKSKFDLLKKPWFAGGTVTLASASAQAHFSAKQHERFENGTVSYVDIPAVKMGLEFLEMIGMQTIQTRITALSEYLYKSLNQLHHSNGQKLIQILGPIDRTHVGGTLSLNFYDRHGKKLPSKEIEKHANAQSISIRTGCFCNPGIDEMANQLSCKQLEVYFSSREEGNYYDMINYLGIQRGAIRISVGIPTIKQDLDTFIRFAQQFLD